MQDKTMVAVSMARHKVCVRASSIKATGMILPMDGVAKTGWDPQNPLHVSD